MKLDPLPGPCHPRNRRCRGAFLRSWFASAAALLFLSLAALSGMNESSASTCEPFQNTKPICLFSNPEDLAVLPDRKVLVVSEYGDIDGTIPGRLAFYDIDTQTRKTAVFQVDAKAPGDVWGDGACTGPPDRRFSPHGIDLSRRPDGRLQLLVVQHGGRESVEFFEVGASTAGWQLTWRGCVPAPPDARLNAVAADGHGGFFTTRMRSATRSNGDPGVVFRWQRASGYSALRGTTGVVPNGIAAAPDGSTIFVVYSGESEVRKFDVATGTRLASATVRFGDNIKWSADGKSLLVASFVDADARGGLARCASSKGEDCRIDFSIIELDPGTLSKTTQFENPAAPMTAGTVGLRVDETLFIGSFTGDRILQVSLEGP